MGKDEYWLGISERAGWFRAHVSINTWHSKTYCRSDYTYTDEMCEAERAALKAFAHTAHLALSKLYDEIRWGHYREEINEAWRHECGWEPRYLTFEIVAEYEPGPVPDFRRINFNVYGGNVWALSLEYREGEDVTVYSDGCWGVEIAKTFLKSLIEEKGQNLID